MSKAPPVAPDELPPAPSTNSPSTFEALMDALLAALPNFRTQLIALATNCYNNAVDAYNNAIAAAASASTATTQAELATTTGAAQVALATTQAGLAAASANFKGNWTDLTGALSLPATVYHDGVFWALNTALGDVTLAEPGVSASWTEIKTGIDRILYEDRDNVRDMSPRDGDAVVIEGLGLFYFYAGSTEPDDDESCFATDTGKWLLEAVHWDVVDTWQMVDDAVRDEWIEDEPLRFATSFATSFATKILTGTATSAITSVNTTTQVSFTGTVAGAAVGDRVVANPPDAVGARIATYCRVTSADTVTIYLNNPSAASQSISAGTWNLTVIKE
jgi:hypothetical protein